MKPQVFHLIMVDIEAASHPEVINRQYATLSPKQLSVALSFSWMTGEVITSPGH